MNPKGIQRVVAKDAHRKWERAGARHKQSARGMTACAVEKKVCNYRHFKNAFVH